MRHMTRTLVTTGLGLGILFAATGLAEAQGGITSSACTQMGGTIANNMCSLPIASSGGGQTSSSNQFGTSSQLN